MSGDDSIILMIEKYIPIKKLLVFNIKTINYFWQIMNLFSLKLVRFVQSVWHAVLETKSILVCVCRWWVKIMWLLFHPLAVLWWVVLASSVVTFPELSGWPLMARAYSATKHALVLACVDNLVYGNAVFSMGLVDLSVTYVFKFLADSYNSHVKQSSKYWLTIVNFCIIIINKYINYL